MPPPLQNNVTDEVEIEEEYFFEDIDQDMNYFGEQLTEGFVTEEDFLNSEYYDADVFQTENDLNLEVTTDIYQYDPKKTLNLISGPKQVVQNPKKKAIPPPKQQSDPTLGKKQNKDKPEKFIEVEEVNKNMQNFNFENKLCKIKVPMPFTELIKNTCYKNSVLKMMGSVASQVPFDTVNLQDENPKIFIGSALAKKTEK